MKLLSLVMSLSLFGCVTASDPKCSDVVAGFYEAGSKANLDVLPPFSHPVMGSLFGLSDEKTKQVQIMCLIPDGPMIRIIGCASPGDYTNKCVQPSGMVFYYKIAPLQAPPPEPAPEPDI